MSKLSTLREVGSFLANRKRYWMIPLLVVLLILGALLVVAETTPVGPFIYTLF
jgi:hypothetical protein